MDFLEVQSHVLITYWRQVDDVASLRSQTSSPRTQITLGVSNWIVLTQWILYMKWSVLILSSPLHPQPTTSFNDPSRLDRWLTCHWLYKVQEQVLFGQPCPLVAVIRHHSGRVPFVTMSICELPSHPHRTRLQDNPIYHDLPTSSVKRHNVCCVRLLLSLGNGKDGFMGRNQIKKFSTASLPPA